MVFTTGINFIKHGNTGIKLTERGLVTLGLAGTNSSQRFVRGGKLTEEGLALLKHDSKSLNIGKQTITMPSRILSKDEFLFFSENLNGRSKEEIEIALDEILNLKYKNGKSIFRIIPKPSESDEKYNVLTHSARALLEMKFSNRQQYNDVLKLIELHNTGRINYCPNFIMPNGKLNSLVKQDMDAILSNRNYFEELQVDSIIDNRLLARVKLGDVFSVGEKMYVRTNNGCILLKMDKQTYKILFPPIDRYAIAQGKSNHCFYLSALNNLIQVPENRIKMYQMFEQNGRYVTVHPLGKYPPTTFNLDNLTAFDNDLYAQTSYGNKMLERIANPFEDGSGVDVKDVYAAVKENNIDLLKFNHTPTDLLNEDPTTYLNYRRYHTDKLKQCVHAAQQKLQTIGNGKTMVTLSGKGYKYGTGNDHCCSVFDFQNGLVKLANPHGTAFYQEVPLDKLYGEQSIYFSYGVFDNL